MLVMGFMNNNDASVFIIASVFMFITEQCFAFNILHYQYDSKSSIALIKIIQPIFTFINVIYKMYSLNLMDCKANLIYVCSLQLFYCHADTAHNAWMFVKHSSFV